MSSFGWFDRMKIAGIMSVRRFSRRSIESWSRSTFRARKRHFAPLGPTLPAADHYGSPILPRGLMVPATIPDASRVSWRYSFPYYILSGIVFTLYRKLPLSPEVPWTAPGPQGERFPPHDEGWTDLEGDEAFTRLRVQGPNPFLLRATGDGAFEVDYGPWVKGAFAPVHCRFELVDGALRPSLIRVDGAEVRPGDPGWRRAKRVANGLDARITVFVRHLQHTHLVFGQAYGMALYSLPADHPLHGFLDTFTFSTLTVNDYAFKLLVTPTSYFIQSNFITGAQVGTLFENAMDLFRLEDLIPPADIAARGIDRVPGHPYVEDGQEIWAEIERFVDQVLDSTHADDAAVKADAALQTWYAALLTQIPGRTMESHPLDTRARLRETLGALVYINVSHEIVGDFSPYLMSDDPEERRIVDVANLLRDDVGPPRAADVFLMDQGAWAGRFENMGNLLVALDPKQVCATPAFATAFEAFQRALERLDDRIAARNATRAVPLLRTQPRRWQASISY